MFRYKYFLVINLVIIELVIMNISMMMYLILEI